jgi:hypothetical protein
MHAVSNQQQPWRIKKHTVETVVRMKRVEGELTSGRDVMSETKKATKEKDRRHDMVGPERMRVPGKQALQQTTNCCMVQTSSSKAIQINLSPGCLRVNKNRRTIVVLVCTRKCNAPRQLPPEENTVEHAGELPTLYD